MNSLLKNLKRLYNGQKGVIRNFSFLSILQILQLLAGLLVYPYLIKVLGLNNYGIVVYAQTIIGYFILIVNYGFNITATKYVSEAKGDNDKISEIFSTVISIKFLFFIISAFLLIISVIFIEFMNNEKEVYLFSTLIIFGWVVFPDWYFQGIEKMENITYVMLTSKLISLSLIFIYVENANDYILVPFFNSLAMILAGFIGFALVFRGSKTEKSRVRFIRPKYENMKSYIRTGSAYFVSNLSANTKDYVNTLIIGAVLSYNEVAIYDIITKVIKVFIMPYNIFVRAVFPKCAMKKSFKFNVKVGNIMVIYGTLMVFFIFGYAETIVSYFIEENIKLSVEVFKVMSLSLPLLALTSSRGLLTLVGFNFDKLFTKGILISIAFYFLSLIVFYLLNFITVLSLSFLMVLSVLVELLAHTYHIKLKEIPIGYKQY